MNNMTSSNRRSFLKTAAALSAGAFVLPKAARAAATPTALTAAPEVKITDVRTYLLPQAIFVEVVSDAGVSGWGECANDGGSLMQAFVNQKLKQWVIGRDPFDTEPLWDLMFYKNHDLGPGGTLTNAIAGIDCAIWDLKGKLVGLPVYKLIGGSYRDRIRAYGSFGIGNEDKMPPSQAARQAAKFVSDGFTAVKVRLQIRELNLNPQPDIARKYVKAVRDAIGYDIQLLVDANNGYTAAIAIQVGKMLYEEFGVWFFEDPVSDQNDREMAQVTAALDIPIIAGEKEYTRWQITDLMLYGNVDFINPDVVKVGGITEFKKIAAIAQTFHKPIIPHNTRPTFSTAASLHLMASMSLPGPVMEFPDIDRFDDLLAVMKNRIEFKDGYLIVPKGIGIGLEVDEAAVKKAVVSV